MRIDAGMPVTLIVGNKELGCFVKEVRGESVREVEGSPVFSRIDEIVIAPWRSPYETEDESLDALERFLGKAGAAPEFYETLEDMRSKAGSVASRASDIGIGEQDPSPSFCK